MRKFYSVLMLVLMVVTSTIAQKLPFVKIHGLIVNQETGKPVVGQTVYISIDSLQNQGHFNIAVSDANGQYVDSVLYMSHVDQQKIIASTYDCRGDLVINTAYFHAGKLEVIIDFKICSDTNTRCEALFKYSPNPDNSLQLAFYDGSHNLPGAGNIYYSWNFGDSSSSSFQNPIHSFNQPGTYDVCLAINSGNNFCNSKICLPVTVGNPTPGPCESSFQYYLDSLSKEYVFEGLALNQQATEWKWDFGDGSSANGQKVTHIFSNTDSSYKVCLTAVVASANGTTCTSTSCQNLFSNYPVPCESSFWYRPDSASGTDFIFEGYAKNNQISSWKWAFGNGTTAIGQKVTHSFANTNADRTVCLSTTAIDSNGDMCTHSSCQDVNIYIPSPCESSFQYYSDSLGGNYTFAGYAKNNQISAWIWDFGDGTTATGQKVSHSFNFNPGSTAGYHVCLTTIGISAAGDSCAYNSCHDINFNPPTPCQNYFKIYTEDRSKYTFSGTVPSAANAYYYWDFGDGTSDSGQIVTHAFGKIYTVFNVCLTTVVPVPGPTGFIECRSVSCQSIYNGVDSSACKAIFIAVRDSTGKTYKFFNHSQRKYSYSHWNFGDGSQSAEVDPVHTYLSPGLYIACLTVADSLNNCKNQSCQEIWVDIIQPGCKASFYILPADSSASASSAYLFINSSTPGYTSQKWSFGDGTGSTDINPVHTYATPGIYTACLTIWDSIGKCNSNYCKDIFAGKVIGENSVSGIVLTGNRVAEKGIVWLISPNNNYNTELLIDSTGIFHFSQVPSGSFYIYAMLTPGARDFFAYMPTYYASSLSWQGATLINSSDANAWYSVNLVPSMAWTQGDGAISGTIFWGGIMMRPGSNPAANVEVVLSNSSGNPIAYTFTDSEGTYVFDHLPYGNYSVQAEMTGRSTEPVVVNLTENSVKANINFVVNEAAINIVGITEPVKSTLLAGNLYPNPVGEILNLKLNASVSGTVVVDIIDVQSRIIHSESISLSGGNNLISIPTGKLTKGIYLLSVKSKGHNPVQRKFIK